MLGVFVIIYAAGR